MPWLMKSENKAGGSPWFRSRYPKNLVFSELQSSTDVYRNLQESTGYGPLADILIPEDVSMVSSGWSGHNSMEYENWKKKQSVVNYRRNSGFLYIPIYSYIFLYDNYDNILLIQRCMSLVLRSPEKFLHQSQTIHWFKELPLLFDSSIFGQTGPATSCNKGRQTCAYCCSRVQ